MDEYYLYVGEQQKGPFTFPQVQNLLKAGKLTAATLCWQQGFKEWVPLSTLKSAPAPQSPRAPRPARPLQPAKPAQSQQPPQTARPIQSAPAKPVAVQRPAGPKITGPLRPKTAPMTRQPGKPKVVVVVPAKAGAGGSTWLADFLIVAGIVCFLYFVFVFSISVAVPIPEDADANTVAAATAAAKAAAAGNPELMQDRLIGSMAGIAACIVGAIMRFLAKSGKG